VVPTSTRLRAGPYLRTARPKQWTKNILVFAAPAAAGVLTHGATTLRALSAMALFACASSGTYFFNDAVDVEADRRHPRKRYRPMAAGALPVGAGATTNFVGGISAGLAAARQLRLQGHGTLVVLSSVAGERVRKANFIYGSTKAGLDGFALGLGDTLAGSGAGVMVVRPGFVAGRMTAGMPRAPWRRPRRRSPKPWPARSQPGAN
jgi:hypothetical protein